MSNKAECVSLKGRCHFSDNTKRRASNVSGQRCAKTQLPAYTCAASMASGPGITHHWKRLGTCQDPVPDHARKRKGQSHTRIHSLLYSRLLRLHPGLFHTLLGARKWRPQTNYGGPCIALLCNHRLFLALEPKWHMVCHAVVRHCSQ